MHNTALIRNLIVYAIVLPLAIVLGYQLTEPLGQGTFFVVGMLVLALAFPILLRWHHFMLVASWNVIAVMFFLPGAPHVWLPMAGLSLGITVLQRSVNRDMRLINEPRVTWSLILLAVTALVTAQLTGGIGLRSFGSEVYGGRRYVYLLGGILAYFALSMQKIPKEKAGLYIAAYCLGGVTGVFGDFFMMVSPAFEFLFWVFPPNMYTYMEGHVEFGTSRLAGMKAISMAGFLFMVSRYGVAGIFFFFSPSGLVVLARIISVGMLGGFRSMLMIYALILGVQFYLEGLHRTKYVVAAGAFILISLLLVVAFSGRLPVMFQRTLSFLPIEVDPAVRLEAQGSVDWRLEIWRYMIPQIPDYFWLGKGYAITRSDFGFMFTQAGGGTNVENWDATVAGDYHNGPLSVLIDFGIWGAVAFVWFLIASFRALLANYRYGPEELKRFNTFLFAMFIARTIYFFTIFGGLHSDILHFAGYIGLSLALNGGVCRPAMATAPALSKVPEMVPIRTRPRLVHP